jgi:hypothetical protein
MNTDRNPLNINLIAASWTVNSSATADGPSGRKRWETCLFVRPCPSITSSIDVLADQAVNTSYRDVICLQRQSR